MIFTVKDFDVGDLLIYKKLGTEEPYKRGIIETARLDETGKIITFKIDTQLVYIFPHRVIKIIRKKENPEYFI